MSVFILLNSNANLRLVAGIEWVSSVVTFPGVFPGFQLIQTKRCLPSVPSSGGLAQLVTKGHHANY